MRWDTEEEDELPRKSQEDKEENGKREEKVESIWSVSHRCN